MHTASRRTLAVLGSPIAHSKSPALHTAAYRELGLPWSYETHEVIARGLEEFIDSRGPHWRGLSLTMPLKQTVIALLDSLDPVATLTGAANTILFDHADDGRRRALRGFNTDVAGIVRALRWAGVRSTRLVHILGGGATAASALVAAAELGAEHVVISVREPARAVGLQPLANTLSVTAEIRHVAAGPEVNADLVISTLPGGAISGIDFPLELRQHSVLFDVAYDPWPSTLALAWAQAEAPVLSGLAMLAHQALLQVRIFVSGDPLEPLADEPRVLAAMLAAVGLEGSGAVPES